MPSRVPRPLSLNLDIFADDMMNDDVSMDNSFIKLLEGENRTGLGNRTATLGYRIARCTTLGSLGLLDSNQLSRIKIQTLVLHPQYFPLGTHPKT